MTPCCAGRTVLGMPALALVESALALGSVEALHVLQLQVGPVVEPPLVEEQVAVASCPSAVPLVAWPCGSSNPACSASGTMPVVAVFCPAAPCRAQMARLGHLLHLQTRPPLLAPVLVLVP